MVLFGTKGTPVPVELIVSSVLLIMAFIIMINLFVPDYSFILLIGQNDF